MKRFFLLGVVALLLAITAYALTRHMISAGEEDQLTWLRREFKLNDTQTAAVEQLQSSYQVICTEHCRLVREAQSRLAEVPADKTLQAEVAQLEATCREGTLRHLREIAAQMSDTDGRRFLALAEPRVSGHEHEGPPGLR